MIPDAGTHRGCLLGVNIGDLNDINMISIFGTKARVQNFGEARRRYLQDKSARFGEARTCAPKGQGEDVRTKGKSEDVRLVGQNTAF